MATLLEYFKFDFTKPPLINSDNEISLKIENGQNTIEVKVLYRKFHDFIANASCQAYYFSPPKNYNYFVCKSIIELYTPSGPNVGIEIVGGTTKKFIDEIKIGTPANIINARCLYIYSEIDLSEKEKLQLDAIAKKKNISVSIITRKMTISRNKDEKPLGFISHDIRDQELIAKPLADGLRSRMCYVWYSEYSLRIGDSLRESIEKGIKDAKKCILILTPNFLENKGWVKKEFDSIFTREMIKKERVIIPIWYNIDEKDIFEYSPSLADTYALMWPDKKKYSNNEYDKEVENLISKIHSELTFETNKPN